MTNMLGKISDFIIKVIMMFTIVVALVYFAGVYPNSSLVFSFLAVLYILAMITKGLVDTFKKD